MQTSGPAQRPSHPSENNEMMWQPSIRNEALLNDIFGAHDYIIHSDSNMVTERKSGINNDNAHAHVKMEQFPHVNGDDTLGQDTTRQTPHKRKVRDINKLGESLTNNERSQHDDNMIYRLTWSLNTILKNKIVSRKTRRTQ